MSQAPEPLRGIIARHLGERLRWRGLVMLAPPNGGSQLASRLRHHPAFRWFYGPAGFDLGSPGSWPAPPAPAGIIAGTRSRSLVNPTSWARLLPAEIESDGTVTVEETRHPAVEAFATVDASHTWIMNHPRTRDLVLRFLEHGRF